MNDWVATTAGFQQATTKARAGTGAQQVTARAKVAVRTEQVKFQQARAQQEKARVQQVRTQQVEVEVEVQQSRWSNVQQSKDILDREIEFMRRLVVKLFEKKTVA